MPCKRQPGQLSFSRERMVSWTICVNGSMTDTEILITECSNELSLQIHASSVFIRSNEPFFWVQHLDCIRRMNLLFWLLTVQWIVQLHNKTNRIANQMVRSLNYRPARFVGASAICTVRSTDAEARKLLKELRPRSRFEALSVLIVSRFGEFGFVWSCVSSDVCT
jgi:hypothetical protein